MTRFLETRLSAEGSMGEKMNCDTKIQTMLFPNRFDTNQAVQAQKVARGWKFWI